MIFITKLFSGVWAKVTGIAIAAFGILLLVLKSEKSKRKAAELEATIERENRELLEKEKEVINNIDKDREIEQEERIKVNNQLAKDLEALKHEENNHHIVNGIINILRNKNDSKD